MKGIWQKMGDKKVQGRVYPFVIFGFIILMYVLIIVILYYLNPLMWDKPWVKIYSAVFVVVYNVLVLLTIYAYLKTMWTNPGKPPAHWGFYLKRSKDRQRQSCQYCNNYKPERSSHCSTCNQCILVRDHHCPWLNTCIGFKNKKIFFLLITYAYLTDIVALLGHVLPMTLLILNVVKGRNVLSHSWKIVSGVVSLVFSLMFFRAARTFWNMHHRLIRQNRTTL